MTNKAKKPEVLYISTKEGWENFGTKYQYYAKPYKVVCGITGKVWKISDGKRFAVPSLSVFKDTGRNFIPAQMKGGEALRIIAEVGSL